MYKNINNNSKLLGNSCDYKIILMVRSRKVMVNYRFSRLVLSLESTLLPELDPGSYHESTDYCSDRHRH